MPARRHVAWRILSLVVLGALIPVSIRYFDRPIADFAETHIVDIQGLGRIAALPGWLLLPALLAPFAIIILNRPLTSKLAQTAMTSSLSIIWTSATVEIVLKRFFGRLQTSSWILQHAYGFHFFAGTEQQFRSFPSGEGAILSAVICVLWPAYPRLRGLLALLAIGETFLILSLNWHFLSDVIAGVLVGVVGSFVATALLRHLSRFRQDPAGYGSTN
jgi:undecaprenyl-diphosphatase